jgi:hypothetical protein
MTPRPDAPGSGGVHVSSQAVPAVPEVVAGEQREVAHNPEELAVMSQVDGHRTVGRIAANLGLDMDEVRVVCERLVRTGVLKLQNRRARTARLVTRLTRRRLAPLVVGIDASILNAWEKVLGAPVKEVACRRDNGSVLLFEAVRVEGSGPYLELSRDTLVRSNLRVEQTLLVRPVTDQT